ncbi:MAG: hypothetical protein O3C10_13445 [Chloroflexi bacterium]|nr:hypothetical protein [Chloroflexota bacterium]
MKRTSLSFLALAATAIVFVSCSGEDGEPTVSTPGVETTSTVGPEASTTIATAEPAPTSTPPRDVSATVAPAVPALREATPEPEFRGYALDLAEGDFWEYRWTYLDTSCAQGSGCSSDEDDGVFQVTLGNRREIAGVPVYELVVTGKPAVRTTGETRDFAPRWRYLGVDGDRLVVSNGSSLTTLFDGEIGSWPGSGFFTDRFDEDDLIVANSGSLTDSFEIADWPGVNQGPWEFVGRAGSERACETFEGSLICPSEESFSFAENEYYRPQVGPVAYRFQNNFSFSGGGFSSSYSTKELVALVASSLRGDAVPSATVPTATPVHPTPTPPPTATPSITSPDLSSVPAVFGPVDGSLLLDPGSNQIPDFSSGLSLVEAVVQVEFTNPDISGGRWSEGITFRQSEEETFHAIYITGDGRWGHFARAGSVSTEADLDSGTATFDRNPGGTNTLLLVFGLTEGQLFVNGDFVANLDLGMSGVEAPGDIRVMTGVFPTDLLDGTEVAYSGFAVWPVE